MPWAGSSTSRRRDASQIIDPWLPKITSTIKIRTNLLPIALFRALSLLKSLITAGDFHPEAHRVLQQREMEISRREIKVAKRLSPGAWRRFGQLNGLQTQASGHPKS